MMIVFLLLLRDSAHRSKRICWKMLPKYPIWELKRNRYGTVTFKDDSDVTFCCCISVIKNNVLDSRFLYLWFKKFDQQYGTVLPRVKETTWRDVEIPNRERFPPVSSWLSTFACILHCTYLRCTESNPISIGISAHTRARRKPFCQWNNNNKRKKRSPAPIIIILAASELPTQ